MRTDEARLYDDRVVSDVHLFDGQREVGETVMAIQQKGEDGIGAIVDLSRLRHLVAWAGEGAHRGLEVVAVLAIDMLENDSFGCILNIGIIGDSTNYRETYLEGVIDTSARYS